MVPVVAERETIVAARFDAGRVPPVTRVRSTLISSSLRAMRERDLLDAYRSRLPAQHHETIFGVVAGTWLPAPIVLEHYRAVDALGLTPGEAVAMGGSIGDSIHGTVLGTALRFAKGAGVTPWVALRQCGKLWERLFEGGDVAVQKVGPKEATLEMMGLPLFGFGYFRASTRGLVQVGLALFCSRVYATEISSSSSALSYRIAWA